MIIDKVYMLQKILSKNLIIIEHQSAEINTLVFVVMGTKFTIATKKSTTSVLFNGFIYQTSTS